MSRQGMESGFRYIDILSEEHLERAINGIYRILDETGVVVQDVQMRKLLRSSGCVVDDANQRVRMPKEAIDQAMQSCPNGFAGKAREEKNDIRFVPGQQTYFLNACGMKLHDIETGESYEPTRKEFYEYLRLMDALPNIDIQNCFPLFGFQGVPECMKLIESAAAKFRVSTKVQIEGSVFDNYVFESALADAVGADLFQIVNSMAPLCYSQENAEQIRFFAEKDIPFHFAAGPTRGITSPMSAVGSAMLNNAEAMAGIVMAQAVRPQARVWVNSMIMTPDMCSGKPAFGDIGNSVTDMIFNQMWRRLQVPCWSNAAAWTSAKEIDYQAGYELTMALMTQAMSGATAISFQSGLYAELNVHPAKAVIDDDIVGMVKRLMRGADVSEDAFAFDLIRETGPLPGSYMNSDMTLFGWRDECYIPQVASREDIGDWLQSGRRSIVDHARQRAEELIQAPVNYLSDAQEAALESVLDEARNYYHSKGMISQEEWELYQQDIHSDNYPFG